MAIMVAVLVIWRASVRSGYQALCVKKSGKKAPTFVQDIKALFDENIHKLLMIVPFCLLMIFTVIPLAYMISMAFTNYNSKNEFLFDWVGFETFAQLFEKGGTISKHFWSVLGWTMIWAFFATFLNFFLGTFMALIINRPTTRIKGFWRTMLSFTIAIPQFVSLLIIGKIFDLNGILNGKLLEAGLISESIRFVQDPMNARIFVIVINLWVGIPYTVMQVTGILKNIPADLYEAARIDGANTVQQFMNITLPYMVFVLTPYIITSFTGNINNFGVIFLLTGGGPFDTGAATEAGKTDLLVTWLYRLSVEKREYNLGAVIGIFTFIILAIISLVTYRSSGSYKDEEGFR
jgi:arabinogalactan oligomer/maltooligosaccharide transport system permease protein